MAKKKKNGRMYSNIGLIFAVLSWISIPIIFGSLAIIFGYKGMKLGDKRGKTVMIFGIIFGVASGILSVLTNIYLYY